MYKTVRIADYELGLLFRDRLFQAVLGPGVHRLLRGVALPEVRTLDLRQMPVKDPALSALQLTRPDVVAAYFVVADMADNQLGLVFADGKLVDLVGPGHRAFYAKGLRKIAVQVRMSCAGDMPFTKRARPGFGIREAVTTVNDDELRIR